MAVVATSVVVIQVPAEMAVAEPLRVQQIQMAPQQEPDRTIGPAADLQVKPKKVAGDSSESSSGSSTGQASESQNGVAPRLRHLSRRPQPPRVRRVTVDVDQTAAAVKMGSVKASVSLDQPLKSNVEIPPVKRKAERVVTTVLRSEAGDEPAAD